MNIISWRGKGENKSSFIDSIVYNQSSEALEVAMKGRKYVYSNVPLRTALYFLTADSKGGYFQSYVRNAYQYTIQPVKKTK